MQAAVGRGPSQRRSLGPHDVTFYDTFDWRLYRGGLELRGRRIGDRRQLALRGLDGTPGVRLEAGGDPGFVWDLPTGPLRSRIESLVEMRRLLPLLSLRSQGTSLALLDQRQKTVARLEFEQTEVVDPEPRMSLPPTLVATPIKGYDKAFRGLIGFLEHEVGLIPGEQTELDSIASRVGIQPGSYSSKLDLHLDPEAPAEEALKQIFQRLLEIIEANEEGVRQDLDSEFLHDFRVAVRRTRSAITQIKGVLPQERLEHFKREFAWLGQITGPSRDLHVYQLKMPDYQARLPEHVRADLEPLRDFLDRHQIIEHRDMAQLLESDRYADLLRDWATFLEHPEATTAEPPEARTPIRHLADQRIWKAFRRVLKKGSAIGDETPAEALHRLRIDCKKLRYLLEFFRSLYDAERITQLIKALKRLQDNLGDFNDLVVQRDSLRGFCDTMLAERSASAATLMATGRLIADLEARQEIERRAFHNRFREFSSPANRKQVQRLFKPAGIGPV
jgi:CHAD domain-containing protein